MSSPRFEVGSQPGALERAISDLGEYLKEARTLDIAAERMRHIRKGDKLRRRKSTYANRRRVNIKKRAENEAAVIDRAVSK